jgi:hypothetical protein
LLDCSSLVFWWRLHSHLSWTLWYQWTLQRNYKSSVVLNMNIPNQVLKKGFFSALTRRDRAPTPSLKVVKLFIMLKQGTIVLAQHERCICGRRWKVENRSHFFPSFLSNNLQIH